MAGSPPNLPVPKGWKPPPGANKPITKYIPRAAPSLRGLTGTTVPRTPAPTGPGYGVLRPGVRSAPAPRPAPSFKPEGRLFSGNNKPSSGGIFGRPLSEVTRENMVTGGLLHGPYREQHPQAARRQFEAEHHQGLFGKVLGFLGEGEHALESGAAKGIGLLQGIPGVSSRTQFNPTGNPQTQQAINRLYGGAAVQAGGLAATAGLGAGLRGLAVGREAAAGSRAASQALKAGELVPGTIAEKAPQTSKVLDNLASITGSKATAGSRALKVGGAAAAGYSKLLIQAAPAKAALAAGLGGEEPKKNEPFAEKFWHSALHTVANFPAATVETALHPIKTAEAMAQLYENPAHAWEENPAGTLLAFLAPAAGVERGGGTLIRRTSKDKLLSLERPDLVYQTGQRQAREYQPGLVTQQLQKAPDRLAKAFGKGEQAHLQPTSGKVTAKTIREAPKQATKLQEKRDIIGSREGGIFRPGQVDYIKNGERLARNTEIMKYNDFLHQHLPQDEHHATAFMTLFEGAAKRPDTFWDDVNKTIDRLEHSHGEITDARDREYSREQVARLKAMQDNKASISKADLKHYAGATDSVAKAQRELWIKLNQEGVGHPDQLNARNIGAVLAHQELMGKGPLHFDPEPGPHPYKEALDKAEQARAAAYKERIQAEAGARAIAGSLKSKGLRTGHDVRLEKAIEHHLSTLEVKAELQKKLDGLVLSKHVKANGDMHPGIFDENRHRISPQEVQQFLDKHFEGRELGFLTQRSPKEYARSGNNWGPRTTFPMRSGGSFIRGTYDNTPAALRNHFETGASTLATMRGLRSLNENLVRLDKGGKPFTSPEFAQTEANRLNLEDPAPKNLGKWVIYDMGAKKALSKMFDGQPFGKHLEEHGVLEALNHEKEQGTWGLLPKDVADRLNKWDRLETHLRHSFMRMATTPWRQTNLYTSFRWPVGTTQENAIRLAFHRVSPLALGFGPGKYTSLSFKTGSDIQRMLDDKINDPTVSHGEKQAALFHRAMFGTGNFVGGQLHELEPALHSLEGHKNMEKIANSPINTKAWRPWRHFVGNSLARMETNAKTATGGKLALNDKAFFDKYRKIDREQAAKDYVEKITTDPAQSIKAAQNLLEVMGNWNHLTPFTRQAQAEFAPFALWWLNSAKFVFKTLPRDHPYATGLLAAMVTATGLENRNLKPYLEGTLPLELPLLGKINLNPVHYSPFDIANEPGQKAVSMIMPQLTEPILTAFGVDPLTHEKFEGTKPGEGNEATGFGRLGVTALENYVPGLRMLSQVLKQGGHLGKQGVLPTEAEKKTGVEKALMKTLFPLMFTYAKPTEKAPAPGEVREPTTREPVTREPVTREPAVR